MAATTPTLGLYKPGGGSSGLITPDETVDIDKLNANADLIDAEALSVRTRLAPLEDQNRQYRGPAAALSGLSGMRLGDEYQETDAEKRRKLFDGTNWNGSENGVIIRPTTVTGGTVAVDGSIDFSGVASVSLDGVFTAKFREYELRYRVTGKPTNQGVSIRLRGGGVDNSAASSYFFRRAVTTGSGYTENTSTLAQFDPDANAHVNVTKSLHLLNPQAAAFTNVWSAGGMEANNAGLLTVGLAAAGQHQVASAFDGITLFLALGGAMTGNLVVVGYP